MNIYDYTIKSADGNDVSLETYKDHVMLIVNTACAWGLTPHFQGLEALYEHFKEQKFIVLAFPCNQFGEQDPGTNDEIQYFTKTKYGVTFPVMAKIDVNGKNESGLFTFLKQASGCKTIKWNFAKFLVNRTGQEVRCYDPTTEPETLKKEIERLLK